MPEGGRDEATAYMSRATAAYLGVVEPLSIGISHKDKLLDVGAERVRTRLDALPNARNARESAPHTTSRAWHRGSRDRGSSQTKTAANQSRFRPQKTGWPAPGQQGSQGTK